MLQQIYEKAHDPNQEPENGKLWSMCIDALEKWYIVRCDKDDVVFNSLSWAYPYKNNLIRIISVRDATKFYKYIHDTDDLDEEGYLIDMDDDGNNPHYVTTNIVKLLL